LAKTIPAMITLNRQAERWCNTLQIAMTKTCQLSGKIHLVNIGSPFLMCLVFLFLLNTSVRMGLFYYNTGFSKSRINVIFLESAV